MSITMEKPSKEGKEEEKSHPTPDDFDEFLPWACTQLEVQSTIHVVRIVQNEYVSVAHTDRSKGKSKSRPKMTHSKADLGSDQKEEKSAHALRGWVVTENIIRVLTIYDSMDNLIHIKFDNNLQVPQLVIKIIGMIIQFQVHLNAITINRGLTAPVVYEVCKLLPNSYITDVCLDNTFLPEANYHILLEGNNSLRNLSLARCKIDDVVVKKIALMLAYPQPASRNLSLLNLSSNRITDTGAKYLGDVLRSNRQLCYLNLASNQITDKGADSILNSLMEFPMTFEEIIESRTRHVTFLKEKNEMISKIIKDLKALDLDRKFSKKKPTRPSTAPSKKAKSDRDVSPPKPAQDARSLAIDEAAIYEKAETMADAAVGEFTDPYSDTETISKDHIVYCIGNNTLAYLNLAYNNITYFSVQKLVNVVLYQKCLNRRPRGIINVCIEGNYLPAACRELNQLDQVLEMGLLASRRLSGVVRRRPQSRK